MMYLCHGVSILSLSMILMFDFGIVPTVFFFSILLPYYITNYRKNTNVLNLCIKDIIKGTLKILKW